MLTQKRWTENYRDRFYEFCSYLNNKVKRFSNGNLQRKNIQVFFQVFRADLDNRLNFENVKNNFQPAPIKQKKFYPQQTNHTNSRKSNKRYNYLSVFEKYNLFGETCYFANYPNCKCKLIKDYNLKGFSFVYKGEKLTGSQCCVEMAKDCHCLKNSKTYQFSQHIIVEKSGKKIIDYYLNK